MWYAFIHEERELYYYPQNGDRTRRTHCTAMKHIRSAYLGGGEKRRDIEVVARGQRIEKKRETSFFAIPQGSALIYGDFLPPSIQRFL